MPDRTIELFRNLITERAKERRRMFPCEMGMTRVPGLPFLPFTKQELRAEELFRKMIEKVREDPEFVKRIEDFVLVEMVLAGD